MSTFKKESLINHLNFDQILDRTLGGIESIVESIFGENEDGFNNQTEFRAVVITNPKTIEPSDVPKNPNLVISII